MGESAARQSAFDFISPLEHFLLLRVLINKKEKIDFLNIISSALNKKLIKNINFEVKIGFLGLAVLVRGRSQTTFTRFVFF